MSFLFRCSFSALWDFWRVNVWVHGDNIWIIYGLFMYIHIKCMTCRLAFDRWLPEQKSSAFWYRLLRIGVCQNPKGSSRYVCQIWWCFRKIFPHLQVIFWTLFNNRKKKHKKWGKKGFRASDLTCWGNSNPPFTNSEDEKNSPKVGCFSTCWKGLPSWEQTVRTWKCMVGILISFWDGLFSCTFLGFHFFSAGCLKIFDNSVPASQSLNC